MSDTTGDTTDWRGLAARLWEHDPVKVLALLAAIYAVYVALGLAIGFEIRGQLNSIATLTFYVGEDDADEVESLLHDRIVDDDTLSSVTVEDGIAVIRVTGGNPSEHALPYRVVDPLADAHIQLYDVVTSATSVSVFVPWDDREQALELVQGVF